MVPDFTSPLDETLDTIRGVDTDECAALKTCNRVFSPPRMIFLASSPYCSLYGPSLCFYSLLWDLLLPSLPRRPCTMLQRLSCSIPLLARPPVCIPTVVECAMAANGKGEKKLGVYLANAAGPVPLVLDLRIAHQRWGRSSDPSINGQSQY